MKKEKLLDLITQKYRLKEKEAIGLILSGNVLINEEPVTKIGIKINNDSDIRIKKEEKYVSRGAYKLLGALDFFSVSVKGKTCLDVGSSTGGFTQVLLEKGGGKIYAVDCGKNQMHYTLRNHPKIIVMENRRISDLKITDFDEKINFAVMDVSFCSSFFLIRYLFEDLNIKEMIILIKPQFEYKRVSRKINLQDNFNGIVKDEKDREKIVEYLKNEILQIGLKVYEIIPSSIKGTKGNLEYLFYIGSL